MMDYVTELKKIYGHKLLRVSLFGSYARGDNRAYSDINVFILVDGRDSDLHDYSDRLYEMTVEFNMKNDVDVQTVDMSTAYYNKWEHVHPFILNIKEEEIRFYG
ncbi:nucleotidyltransferase domain-containing protein [Selenomonas ruminantium]|nr:nucleotidyltransferase domain-containing protein [Selenomonas ruminantium]